MTKKKPDFLRDLDTAIMDELTGGGIKGNAAGLVGTLTQIKEIKQLCGLPFCGYMAKLETVRPSGVPDEVTVVFAEDVPYRACNGIEFDVIRQTHCRCSIYRKMYARILAQIWIFCKINLMKIHGMLTTRGK